MVPISVVIIHIMVPISVVKAHLLVAINVNICYTSIYEEILVRRPEKLEKLKKPYAFIALWGAAGW